MESTQEKKTRVNVKNIIRHLVTYLLLLAWLCTTVRWAFLFFTDLNNFQTKSSISTQLAEVAMMIQTVAVVIYIQLKSIESKLDSKNNNSKNT